VIKFVMNFKEPTHRSHPISTSGVERAYSMCQAKQSVLFPQDNLCHFVLEFGISPKYSGTQIIARDSHSNQLTSEDTEYNLSV